MNFLNHRNTTIDILSKISSTAWPGLFLFLLCPPPVEWLTDLFGGNKQPNGQATKDGEAKLFYIFYQGTIIFHISRWALTMTSMRTTLQTVPESLPTDHFSNIPKVSRPKPLFVLHFSTKSFFLNHFQISWLILNQLWRKFLKNKESFHNYRKLTNEPPFPYLYPSEIC